MDISQLHVLLASSQGNDAEEQGYAYSRIPYHSWLCLVENQVVDFVISMNGNGTVERLAFWIAEELHYFVHARYFSDSFTGLNIHCCGLNFHESF